MAPQIRAQTDYPSIQMVCQAVCLVRIAKPLPHYFAHVEITEVVQEIPEVGMDRELRALLEQCIQLDRRASHQAFPARAGRDPEVGKSGLDLKDLASDLFQGCQQAGQVLQVHVVLVDDWSGMPLLRVLHPTLFCFDD